VKSGQHGSGGTVHQYGVIGDRFFDACYERKVVGDVSQQWATLIHQRYCEPHRHYHNVSHIEALFRHFDH
jgi:predicted metal-dependent HD superfamily phosphohydrolase